MKNIKTIYKKAKPIVLKTPATIFIAFITIVIGIFSGAIYKSAEVSGLVDKYGYGLEAIKQGDFLNIFLGAFISPEPWMYITILIPLIIGGGYLEYHYGTLRMLVAFLLSHFFSVLFVALLLFVFSNLNIYWAVELSKVYDVGLSNAAFGVLGTATAGFGNSIRIRFRVGVFLFLLAMILFSGNIWDLTHFIAFIFGLAIGPWVIGKSYIYKIPKLKNVDIRTITSMIVLFIVIANIVSKIYPGNGGLLNFDNTANQHAISTVLLLVSSCVYLVVSYGLYRGRYFSWIISIFLSLLIIISSLFEPNAGLMIFNFIIGLTLLSILVIFRNSFKVKANKSTIKQLIIYSIAIAFLIFITHVLLIFSLKQSFIPKPGISESISESLHQTIGIPESQLTPSNLTARLTTELIDTFWLIYLLIVLLAIVISTNRNHFNSVSKEDYINLLKQKGGSTISWMGTWPKIRYWANSSKSTIIAYRLINNVAIVLSDPIGSYQSNVKAYKDFDNYCYQYGWEPVYFSVNSKTKNLLIKQGYNSVPIGEDTIINLPNLEFNGKSWQSVRSAINKAEKNGIIIKSLKYTEAPLAIKDQLHAIADSWVADKSLPEMGFTLGTLKQAKDDEVILIIAVDDDGTVHGMTTWLPVYQEKIITGWTIDIMQRRLSKNTMPGVIEFLIAKSALKFKDENYKFISLSAAPLASENNPKGTLEKFLRFMSIRLEPYYGFKSLYNFKKKFNPEHQTIYLCFKDTAKLPAITMAIAKAYTNDTSLIKTALKTIK